VTQSGEVALSRPFGALRSHRVIVGLASRLWGAGSPRSPGMSTPLVGVSNSARLRPEQQVRCVAIRDGHMLHAADVVHGGLRDRVQVAFRRRAARCP